MGHLVIVDPETLNDMINFGRIGIKANLGEKWLDTTSNIFSDLLAVRKGDYIFPWITSNGSNIGFQYIFRAEGKPYFCKGEDYPLRIALKPEGIKFKKILTESESFDLFGENLLWNAIGKKSLQRGRAIVHQTPMEDDFLYKKMKENSDFDKIDLGKEDIKENISINTYNDSDSDFDHKINDISKESRLKMLELNEIKWNDQSFFRYEKSLEAWMMENIDGDKCNKLRNILNFPNDLKWFGNYLPYGVLGENIDIVIFYENSDNNMVVNIIELKRNKLNDNCFIAAADQLERYSKFIKRAFESYNCDIILKKIIISGGKTRTAKNYLKSKDDVKWVSYQINEIGDVVFSEIL